MAMLENRVTSVDTYMTCHTVQSWKARGHMMKPTLSTARCIKSSTCRCEDMYQTSECQQKQHQCGLGRYFLSRWPQTFMSGPFMQGMRIQGFTV